uniref:Uncharacterized protein n=1 Tax=Aegilops tauschii TaxID=37682 RepID=N1R3A5_AEGTA
MSHLVVVVASLAVVLLARCAAAYPWHLCGTAANFTANSTYQANLGLLAAALPKNISSSRHLFATAVVGAAPDQVSALALCRGDANATACSGCLAVAFQDVQNQCAYDKDAAIYYDPCALYYSSNATSLASMDNVGRTNRVNNQNVTSDPGRFNRQAAAPGRRPRGGSPARRPRSRFTGSVGGRSLGVRCSYRYETYSFLDGPVMVRLAAPPSSAAPAPAPAVGPTVPTPGAVAGETLQSITSGCRMSEPNTKQTSHQNLTSNAGCPIPATYQEWVTHRSGALTKATAAIIHLTIFRAGINAKTLPDSSRENMESVESMLIDISTLRAATGGFAVYKFSVGFIGVVLILNCYCERMSSALLGIISTVGETCKFFSELNIQAELMIPLITNTPELNIFKNSLDWSGEEQQKWTAQRLTSSS